MAILRQRLSVEYPEAANHTLKISPVYGYTPLINWLAFDTQAKRYSNKYARSIAHELEITNWSMKSLKQIREKPQIN